MPNQTADCCPRRLGVAPLAEAQAAKLAVMFKALGDPARLRLMSLIASHPGGEACVCEISVHFDVSQPTISHHLKLLRKAGLLECERRGTWVYYWVVPSVLQQLSLVLTVDDDHLVETSSGCCP
ncbi:MAG TPA: metalloregulator ArsR/SmtB family transcription factor [Mycobacterium sp.]